jgi:hypothetical protein
MPDSLYNTIFEQLIFRMPPQQINDGALRSFLHDPQIRLEPSREIALKTQKMRSYLAEPLRIDIRGANVEITQAMWVPAESVRHLLEEGGLFRGRASWFPEDPVRGEPVTIEYIPYFEPDDSSGTTIWLHWGVNKNLVTGAWGRPPEESWPPGSELWRDGAAVHTPMEYLEDGVWTCDLRLPEWCERIDFVFQSGELWDNNGGLGWRVTFAASDSMKSN